MLWPLLTHNFWRWHQSIAVLRFNRADHGSWIMDHGPIQSAPGRLCGRTGATASSMATTSRGSPVLGQVRMKGTQAVSAHCWELRRLWTTAAC